MKNLKKILLSFAFILTIVFAANAQETMSAEKKKLIGEIIILTKYDKTIEKYADFVLALYEVDFEYSLRNAVSKYDLSEAEKRKLEKIFLDDKSKFTNEFKEKFRNETSLKNAMETDFYTVYSKVFTESELTELMAFYKTQTGQKLTFQIPSSMNERTNAKYTESLMPIVQKIVQEIVREQVKNLRVN